MIYNNNIVQNNIATSIKFQHLYSLVLEVRKVVPGIRRSPVQLQQNVSGKPSFTPLWAPNPAAASRVP